MKEIKKLISETGNECKSINQSMTESLADMKTIITNTETMLNAERQGQVLSPRLYLIFVNDLMNILDSSEHCLKIQGSKYGCPTSADDMVLVSLTKRGLDYMLEICFENSLSERYLYNAQKSNVVVFNESKNDFENNERKFKLGKESIKETDSYVHLGIPCNKYMALNENVNLACSKIRKTYYSLADCGVHKNGLHPLSSKHLYETVVLSKALYGSEMWCDLTDDQILSLERAHRQCVKNMQSMHLYTRTDVALSSMGILPLKLINENYFYLVSFVILTQEKESKLYLYRDFSSL